MKIEEKLFNLLKKYNLKISVAESCTGGLVAGKIINVSGASEILDMSFVTYANRAKVELLGVDESTLEKFGAVSEEVAGQMAEGVKKKAGADVGLSTSGVAGPTGGTKRKPVGMVCFGVSLNGKVYTFTHTFKNVSREYIRKSSVNYVLLKATKLIEQNYSQRNTK